MNKFYKLFLSAIICLAFNVIYQNNNIQAKHTIHTHRISHHHYKHKHKRHHQHKRRRKSKVHTQIHKLPPSNDDNDDDNNDPLNLKAMQPKHNMLSWECFSGAVNRQRENDHNIYYSINGDSDFDSAFKKAVDEWNKLGVIHLVQDNNKATIHLRGDSDQSDDDEHGLSNRVWGMTSNYTNNASETTSKNNNIKYFSKSEVYLSSRLIPHDVKYKKFIALHEIGHALGFDDEHELYNYYNIMFESSEDNPYEIFPKLTESERMTLNHYYNEY